MQVHGNQWFILQFHFRGALFDLPVTECALSRVCDCDVISVVRFNECECGTKRRVSYIWYGLGWGIRSAKPKMKREAAESRVMCIRACIYMFVARDV